MSRFLAFARRYWRFLIGVAAVLLLAKWSLGKALGPEVVTALVARQDIVSTVVATGRVMPPSVVSLGALQTGRVVNVLVEEGDLVKANDLLVEFASKEAQAAVEQAQAGVAQARARYAQIENIGSRMADEAVRQARTRVDEARENLERIEALADSGAVSTASLDQARRDLDLALSTLESAESQAQGMAPQGSERGQAAAALRQSEASLTAARARLEDMRIRAPSDGIVMRRDVEPGDVVQAGRILLQFARSGDLLLLIQPDEKNLAFLERGQRAVASADAFGAESFAAVVTSIAPAVDAQRGTVDVKLAVISPPAYLRPDMTVSVEIMTRKVEAALVVPREAVQGMARRTERSPWVWRVNGNRVAAVDVEVGILAEDAAEIRSGLGEGDEVVWRTPVALQPGDRVRPIMKKD